MFGMPLFSASVHPRHGAAQIWSESVATFGLLLVIWSCVRFRPSATAYAVGAYITAAYWFTASTSFANPAVTLARSASNTFAGIRPVDAPAFVAAQLFGAFAATRFVRWLGTEHVELRQTQLRRSGALTLQQQRIRSTPADHQQLLVTSQVD
jgi:glycerol uptake facilitator-like aquaporin